MSSDVLSFPKALRALLSARGAPSLIVCQDRDCCAHGIDDVVRDPRRHAARRSSRLINELATVPDSKRAEHLVMGPVADTAKLAGGIRRLKPTLAAAEKYEGYPVLLGRRLDKHSHTKEKIRDALENLLHERADDLIRSRPVIRRNRTTGSGIARGVAV